VRRLNVDVVPANEGRSQPACHRERKGGRVAYLNEMKSPSFTKVIVRLLSSLRSEKRKVRTPLGTALWVMGSMNLLWHWEAVLEGVLDTLSELAAKALRAPESPRQPLQICHSPLARHGLKLTSKMR
jgi:hypothetical protein